ncbi:hypothetical protein AB0J80_32105 [Actinoplanes sp. NPDC049548]|uniref:hypothetical protein n=1 Tax=Actinoplanes sp. NPDC049548 TaxID=3155152 RepID=UPI00342F41A6
MVSALPWTLMAPEKQTATLDAVTKVLSPSGRFATIAYRQSSGTAPGRRFVAALRQRFALVERSPIIWANIPPAVIHHAAQPLRQS